MKVVKSALVLIVIVAVFGAAMFGLNFITGPLAEANRAGDALAPLLAVMPEGSSFGADALVYDADDPASSALTDVGATVLKIYREANGAGYAVQSSTVDNYTGDPMTLTFGVDAEGKICGIQIDNYTDSIDVREKDANFLPSFIGQDSALTDVSLVAGCTFSSTSIRNAVLTGMEALISNDMIAAGVKTPAQILTEMIPILAPAMAQTEAIEDLSGSMEAAYSTVNGTGFAYIMTEGDNSFLALVNASGHCAVFDVDANDVTADHADLAEEAKTDAASRQEDYSEAGSEKIGRMFEGAEGITPVEVPTFGSVVYAATFQFEGANYTAFYCRPVGFDQMDVYVVLDETGAIAKADAKQLFFETDYFPVDDTVDQPAYKEAFNGMTADAFPEDAGVISGATMTSNAMRLAITDSFAAFAQLLNGGN